MAFVWGLCRPRTEEEVWEGHPGLAVLGAGGRGAWEIGVGVGRRCCQPTVKMEKTSVGLGGMSLLGSWAPLTRSRAIW